MDSNYQVHTELFRGKFIFCFIFWRIVKMGICSQSFVMKYLWTLSMKIKRPKIVTWLFFFSSSVITWVPMEMEMELEMESWVQWEEPPPASAPWLLVSQPHSASLHTALTTSRGHSGAGRRRQEGLILQQQKVFQTRFITWKPGRGRRCWLTAPVGPEVTQQRLSSFIRQGKNGPRHLLWTTYLGAPSQRTGIMSDP